MEAQDWGYYNGYMTAVIRMGLYRDFTQEKKAEFLQALSGLVGEEVKVFDREAEAVVMRTMAIREAYFMRNEKLRGQYMCAFNEGARAVFAGTVRVMWAKLTEKDPGE